MRTPKVGDIAVLHMEVLSIRSDGYPILKSSWGACFTLYPNSIHEFISPPWEPKVGDTVFYTTSYPKLYTSCSTKEGVTLLCIHEKPNDGRKWAVVAFRGDIPKSVYFHDLRETYDECVD